MQRLVWQARSNPLVWWWGSLTLVSVANILVWFLLYREFYLAPAGSSANSGIGGTSAGAQCLRLEGTRGNTE